MINTNPDFPTKISQLHITQNPLKNGKNKKNVRKMYYRNSMKFIRQNYLILLQENL